MELGAAGAAYRRAGAPVRSLLYVFPLLDVVELADARRAARRRGGRSCTSPLATRFDVDRLPRPRHRLCRADRWQTLARSALRDDLYAALARLTADVLACTPAGPPQERIARWEAARTDRVAAVRSRLQAVSSSDVLDLAAMSVVVRTLRTLLDVRVATP